MVVVCLCVDMNPRGSGRDLRFGVAAAVVVAGVLVAVLWVSTEGDDPPTVAPTTTAEGSTTSAPGSFPTESVDSEPRVLAELVPGVTGTLNALVGSSSRWLVEMPAENTALIRAETQPLGFVERVTQDASGELLAYNVLGNGTDIPHSLVVCGNGTGVEYVDAEVVDHQWHQSDAGRLALLIVDGGSTRLETVTLDPNELEWPTSNTITEVDPDQTLLAWGDYGFVLTGYDTTSEVDVTTLLDQSGEVVWQEENLTVISASPTRLLAHQVTADDEADFENMVIDPTDPDTGLRLDLGVRGIPTGADWAPDGRLAIHYPTGGHQWNLRIYDPTLRDFEETPVEGWRVWDLQWDPDSRFILMPGTDDAGRHVVLFYDTTTTELSLVDFGDWIHWANLSRP